MLELIALEFFVESGQLHALEADCDCSGEVEYRPSGLECEAEEAGGQATSLRG